LWFVCSAACVAALSHWALKSPILAVGFGAVCALAVVRQLVRRRRLRRTLTSGDPDAVLELWGPTLSALPHARTLVPLMSATALTASGHLDRARLMLGQAARGPAWDAALEHRLLLETLLDSFEGERDVALSKAQQLEALPLPPGGGTLRRRVLDLRAALSAFARAFARQSQSGDGPRLARAAKRTPVLCWALRYAAAIAHIDAGDPRRARALLDNAPAWPEDSAFSSFHRELLQHSDVGAS